MAYTKYSLTPANNTATPPDGAPEGMLPSAVNDTMRDMMAQIRDCGDGIRDGTYTMTAPKITGGTITGAAFTGNTFTSPVISGGSINNTPIGATTANTGRFSDLTDTGLTSGRVIYATTGGNLTDSANFTFNGTTVTMANNASINGLTVGRGNNSVDGNTAVGASALAANSATGYNQTAIGYFALRNVTTGGGNTAVGVNSLLTVTTGSDNNAFGYETLKVNTASYNCAFGSEVLKANTTGASNVGFGNYALYSNTTASNNTAVGYQAGYSNTTATSNAFFGYQAGYSSTTAANNAMLGFQAGYSLTTGGSNTFVGTNAGDVITTGTKNTIVGRYNGNQDNFDIRTASKYIVISDGDGERAITAGRGNSLALNDATPKAGTGITFPATQSASSDANTLDDYEEGTWTPVIGGSDGQSGQSYTTQSATYTKIGNRVIATFKVQLSTKGTISGTYLKLKGLPFTINSADSLYGSILYFVNLNTNWISINLQAHEGTTECYIWGMNSAGLSRQYPAVTDVTNTTEWAGTFIYRVA